MFLTDRIRDKNNLFIYKTLNRKSSKLKKESSGYVYHMKLE